MLSPSFNPLQDSHPQLCDAIAQRITDAAQQQISFAEFMELALYHPQYGYYATNTVDIGVRGDFFTSPHLSADFGELLAEQFAELWSLLGHPQPFTLVEMGAGQGLLVQDILRYLHRHHNDCFAALEYVIVERSPALVAEQQQRYQKLAEGWGHLSWKTWDDIPSNSITGCFFSNELVDAFPIHQVIVRDGQLQEIYVTLGEAASDAELMSGSGFVEQVGGLSTPELATYFERSNIDLLAYGDGYRTEVNLAALEWMRTVADRLRRGHVLTVDYGYPATRFYSRGRSQGTLQCYYQHAHHNNPYLYVGHQDITAHVNFTALEQEGDGCGLRPVGFTQQALFLMALGLGDRMAALSEPTESLSTNDILRRRDALHSLINPMGLGNFGVLLQAKGVEAMDVPRGFAMV